MLLREFFPGVIPPQDAGLGGNARKPRGSGSEWKLSNEFPYDFESGAPPLGDVSDEDYDTSLNDDHVDPDDITMKFATKIGTGFPRTDAGYKRTDAGNGLGQSGTFNALPEWAGAGVRQSSSVGFMPNSIVPLVHVNRMTNRTQDLRDPAQIPQVTIGPGVKHRTGTVYGTSHASFLAGDDLLSYNPGAGDILPDRDSRGLVKSMRRFRDLMHRQYGSDADDSPVHPRNVIVSERA